MTRFARIITIAVAVGALCVPAAASAAKDGLPGTGDRSFSPGPQSTGNHCITPDGVDANVLLGISQQLFQPDGCFVLETGEFYVPLGVEPGDWYTNTFWEAVPADYIPSAPTPMEDFASKVRAVTYVVDPGTKREHAYRYAAQDIIDVRTLQEFFPQHAPAWPTAMFLAKLPPLPAGDHRLGTTIEMSARHCDGLGADPAVNCLSAGTTRLTVCPFKVVQRDGSTLRP